MTTPTLKQSQGVPFTRIYSYGAARGDLSVPNEDLIGPIDSSDEWIRQRTGIITRTRASAGILAVDLATDAAAEAIEKSGVDPAEIDLVIVATISNVQQTPSAAAVVAVAMLTSIGNVRAQVRGSDRSAPVGFTGLASSIYEAGYGSCDLDDLVRLRDQGITASFIKKANKQAGEQLTVAELLKVRTRGEY